MSSVASRSDSSLGRETSHSLLVKHDLRPLCTTTVQLRPSGNSLLGNAGSVLRMSVRSLTTAQRAASTSEHARTSTIPAAGQTGGAPSLCTPCWPRAGMEAGGGRLRSFDSLEPLRPRSGALWSALRRVPDAIKVARSGSLAHVQASWSCKTIQALPNASAQGVIRSVHEGFAALTRRRCLRPALPLSRGLLCFLATCKKRSMYDTR